MVLIKCSTIISFGMANNFYNINIQKYNPADRNAAMSGGNNAMPVNEGQNITTPDTLASQTLAYINAEQHKEQMSHTRLNALDSTILENEAYQNIDDEVFKTEYKINRLEEGIKSLNKEIEDAKSINDTQKVDILVMRRRSLQAQLDNLNKTYSQTDVSAKLSGGLVSAFKVKPGFLVNMVKSCTSFMSGKVLPKISKKFKSGQTIKSAVNKLETLNKNVDEIVTTQAPYGEAEERYDMLAEYLNSANVIHFKISKTAGTPTFFDTINSIDKEKLNLESKKNRSNFGNMTGGKRVAGQ